MKTHWMSFLVMLAVSVGCQSPPFNNPLAGRFGKNLRQPPTDTAASGPSGSNQQTKTNQSGATGVGNINSLLSQAHSAFLQADRLERQNRHSDAQRLYAQAKSLYQQVLQLDPNNSTAHHRLAVLADKQGDFRTAESHYLSAIKTDPNNADLLNDLGYSYLLQGRYAEAERYLQSALEHNPAHPQAINNLGLLYVKQGDYQRALAMFRRTGSESEARRKLAQLLPAGQTVDQVLAGNLSTSAASKQTRGPTWPAGVEASRGSSSQISATPVTQSPAQVAAGSGWPPFNLSSRPAAAGATTQTNAGSPAMNVAAGLGTSSGTVGQTPPGQPNEQTLRLRAMMDAARQRSIAQRARSPMVGSPATNVGGVSSASATGRPDVGGQPWPASPTGQTANLGQAATSSGATPWPRQGGLPLTPQQTATSTRSPWPSNQVASSTGPSPAAGASPSGWGTPSGMPMQQTVTTSPSTSTVPQSTSSVVSQVLPGSSPAAASSGFEAGELGAQGSTPVAGPPNPNVATNAARATAVTGMSHPTNSLPLWPPPTGNSQAASGTATGASPATASAAVASNQPSTVRSYEASAIGARVGASPATSLGRLPAAAPSGAVASGAGLPSDSMSGQFYDHWTRQAAELGMQAGPGQMFPLSTGAAPSVLPGTNSKINGAQYPPPQSWPVGAPSGATSASTSTNQLPPTSTTTAIQQTAGFDVTGSNSASGFGPMGASAATRPSGLPGSPAVQPNALSSSPYGAASSSTRTAATDPLAEYERQIQQQNEERLRLQQTLDASRRSAVPPQWPYSPHSGRQ